MRNTAPTREIWNRDDGNEHGAQRSEEQEDHHDHDEQRLAERCQDLVDGILDIRGRIVGNADMHPRRRLRLNAGDLCANAMNDVE